MKNFFRVFLVALLSWASVTSPVLASWNNSDLINANKAEPALKNSKYHGYKLGSGKCVFDPSGDTSERTIAAHGCGLTIPKGALVKFAAYKVLTTFTSATDAATIAVSIVGANDVVSAVAISTGTTWDAGAAVEGIPKLETTSTWLTTTANSEVTFTVATEALTAGKLVIWVEWLYYGDV